MKTLLAERQLTPDELAVITSIEVKPYHFSKAAWFRTKNGVALSFGWILDLDDDAEFNLGDKISPDDVLIRKYSNNGYKFECLTKKYKTMTKDEALATAAKYGLEYEVQHSLDEGFTPEGALAEWDIL